MVSDRDALESIWPFIEEELGTMVTFPYAEAIKKVAAALGKKVVIQKKVPNNPSFPTMYYVEEIES